jgi:hypothetical protein
MKKGTWFLVGGYFVAIAGGIVFDLDALTGWAVISAPFVAVLVSIKRKQGQQKGAGFTTAHTGPEFNTNGLPMTGAVDVAGNPYGATSTHGGFGNDF